LIEKGADVHLRIQHRGVEKETSLELMIISNGERLREMGKDIQKRVDAARVEPQSSES
jgi:hypothetical protein